MATVKQKIGMMDAGRKLVALVLMSLLMNPAAALSCATPADVANVESGLSPTRVAVQVAKADLPPCHLSADQLLTSNVPDQRSTAMDCCDEAQCQCETACQSMAVDSIASLSAVAVIADRPAFATAVAILTEQPNPFRPPIA